MRSTGSSATFLTLGSICLIVLVFFGIGIAIILSIIPAYLTTRNITPAGEKYCINNLLLNVTFNTSSPYGGFNMTSANASYPLSQACYRILQNSKSDNLLSACIISNCSLGGIVAVNNTIANTNVTCSAEIYYSSRCPDQAANLGLYYSVNTSSSSTCRLRRMKNINNALGSTSIVQFPNVIGLILANLVIPIQSIFSYPFVYYSQLGAFYCGIVNRTAITAAVNAQAIG